MEDLVKKIGHRIGEVSDRAIRSVYSKITANLFTIPELLQIENGAIGNLLLHWINERQTQADIQTLNSALKLILEISLTTDGHNLLTSIQAVEYFNSYYKYVPTSLQSSVTSILNALISPSFTPTPHSQEDIIPMQTILDHIPKIKGKLPEPIPEETSASPSEFPPVLLCESDEKILFDLAVTLKFANAEEIIQSCSEFNSRILKDFPCETLLQHSDVIRSLVALIRMSSQKNAVDVALSALAALNGLMRKLRRFYDNVKGPDTRVASCLPKKIVVKMEYLDISVPCLKVEQWEIGTPGPTMSLLYAVEFIVTELPLDDFRILSPVLDLWQEAEWAFPKLFEYPKVLGTMLDLLSSSITTHTEKNSTLDKPQAGVYIKKLINTAKRILLTLPVSSIGKCLDKSSNILKHLANYLVFQGEDCEKLLPYIEQLDPELVNEYQYGVKCSQALEAYKTMKQMLVNEKILPIPNLGVFNKAVEFFGKVVPVLEFDPSVSLISSIVDLACYSLYIEKNSTSLSYKEKCLDLVLALVCSTLPVVYEITMDVIAEFLDTEIELTGIAAGNKRKDLVKELVLNSDLLAVIIVKHKNCKLLYKLLETPEDYEKVLPFFTILQSFGDDNLEGILHMLTISTPAAQPLRFIRDLFNASPSRRTIAVMVLRNATSPEKIQEEWEKSLERMWDKTSIEDPVTNLAAIPELDLKAQAKPGLSQEDILNLLNLYRSTSLDTNLKVAAAEQILIHLQGVFQYDSIIEEIINISINNLLPDNEDRYVKRLLSKSLQILVIISLKYQAQAKKLYMAPVKFICSLIPYIFNTYDQIRHYSMFLIFVLAFSAHTTRNRFVPPEVFSLVPDLSSDDCAVPIISTLTSGFLMPFPIKNLTPEVYQTASYMKYWEYVPSSARVKSLVSRKKPLEIDADGVLDIWGKDMSQGVSHRKILEIAITWQSTIKAAYSLSNNIVSKLLNPQSELVSGILTLLRAPPVNSSEDSLQISLQQLLRSIIALIGKTKPELEFIQALSLIVQKNALPFLNELSDLQIRKPLVLSTLSLVQSLLPLHGSAITPDLPLCVLSKFQLEPGPGSFISLLHKISSTTDDISLIESLINTLSVILEHHQLTISLDVKTSPIIQGQIKDILKNAVNKLCPFIGPSTFVYKSAAKNLLHLLIKIYDITEFDSYMWCVRLSEDRDYSVRFLAWGFMSLKAMEVYELHSSVLDMALETLFGLPEAYGVKVQAGKYLCEITEVLMNTEDHGFKDIVMKVFYQYAVVSHIKTIIYENAGPPPVYFAVLVTLLNNLMVLDSKKIISICIQIDVWDGIIRLLRPGALEERADNESRKACKGYKFTEYEQVLITIISFSTFLTNIIRNELQILDYLLESTHFLIHITSWIGEIITHFDHTKELIYSKALLGIINTLHISIYKSQKTHKHLYEFSYENIVKILDLTKSKDLKLAIARLLTGLLSFIPTEKCEGILLHLVSLYKDDNVLSEQKEIMKSLTSLLYYDENSKGVALKTGLQDYLLEIGLKMVTGIQNLEVQKVKRKDEEGALAKQLIEVVILYKMWAANSYMAKVQLTVKDGKVGSLLKLLFVSWQLSLRRDELLKVVLETICTVISNCEEAKKACAIVQDTRYSLLSYIIEYISRPNSASETCFHLSLKILGSLCSCKESRQLLIKSKYPQGLTMRLIKEWNETKLSESIPPKSPYIIEFLTTFAFFPEGQKVIASIGGIIDILVEILDKFSKSTMNYDTVENALLLLRNLSFSQTNKPHVVANQQALPLILSYISSPSQKARLRKLASSTLWALLYHYQKFKGILSKEAVFMELESVYKEVSRDAERCKDKEVAEDLRAVSENLNCVLKICSGN